MESHRSKTFVVWVTTALVGLVAGCPNSPSPMSPTEFFERMAELSCERALKCEDRFGPSYPDVETCRQLIERALSGFFSGAQVDVDESKADTCLSLLEGCELPSEQLEDGCQGAFFGRAQAGDCCDDTYVYCAPGLFCSADRVCQPMAKVQEACNDGRQCAEGLRCDPSTDTCQERKGLGEPCSHSSECKLYMVARMCIDGTCQEVAMLGDECSPAPVTEDPCFGSLLCIADPGEETGSCQPPATQVGDACFAFSISVPDQVVDAPVCAVGYGLVCDPSTRSCVEMPTEGEDCSRIGFCGLTEDLTCVPEDPNKPTQRVCTRRLNMGDACDPDSPYELCPLDGVCDSESSKCVSKPTCEQ